MGQRKAHSTNTVGYHLRNAWVIPEGWRIIFPGSFGLTRLSRERFFPWECPGLYSRIPVFSVFSLFWDNRPLWKFNESCKPSCKKYTRTKICTVSRVKDIWVSLFSLCFNRETPWTLNSSWQTSLIALECIMHRPGDVSVSPACLSFLEAETSSPQWWLEEGPTARLPGCSKSLGKWVTLLGPQFSHMSVRIRIASLHRVVVVCAHLGVCLCVHVLGSWMHIHRGVHACVRLRTFLSTGSIGRSTRVQKCKQTLAGIELLLNACTSFSFSRPASQMTLRNGLYTTSLYSLTAAESL